MEHHDQIIELLRRIEQNQEKALEAQEKHLALAQAQLDRSSRTIEESMQLQRVAVARQAQVRNIAFPLILLLIALLVYVMIRWRIF